ncbi:MAG: thioredoxin domain-containing protein [Acetobacteraceae bacterium]|nr:thioredoxin domain-containing protein [Acetobacteraceae bacterium]
MLAERAVGPSDAPVTVIEYFSLTCPACATFHRDTWPRVRADLVERGRVRHVFADFPLDQAALAAAMLARALPAEQYEPFVSMLLSAQSRWATRNFLEELAKLAALAGMSRDTFQAALRSTELQRGVLEIRLRGEQEHRVTSTPTFIFSGRVPGVAGAIGFERYLRETGLGG